MINQILKLILISSCFIFSVYYLYLSLRMKNIDCSFRPKFLFKNIPLEDKHKYQLMTEGFLGILLSILGFFFL
jgi:hypothetical protein